MDEDVNPSSENKSDAFIYCGETWAHFWDPYNSVDEPLKLTLCILGIITNTLNIIIFSQRHMKNPPNKIFLALSFVDCLFLLRKVIESIVEFHRRNNGDGRTLDQVKSEFYINEFFFHLFHTTSIFLTLLVGFWWVLTVTASQLSRCKSLLTERTAYIGIFTVVTLSSILVAILQAHFHYDSSLLPRNHVRLIKTEIEETGRWELELVGLWILGVCTKLLPCLILTIQSALLIGYLIHAQKRERKQVTPDEIGTNQVESPGFSSIEIKGSNSKNSKEQIQMARIILTILVIRLVTELPMGILNGIQLGTFGENPKFQYECLDPMFLFFSLCEYVSSSVTCFFVFFVLSGEFRATICHLIVNKLYIPYSSSPCLTSVFKKSHSRKIEMEQRGDVVNTSRGKNSQSTTTVCTNSAAENEEDVVTTAV